MNSRTVLQALMTVSLLPLLSSSSPAAEHAIDTARSKIVIHVGKSGLFSAAGHEHEVSAPIGEGAMINLGPVTSGFESQPPRSLSSQKRTRARYKQRCKTKSWRAPSIRRFVSNQHLSGNR